MRPVLNFPPVVLNTSNPALYRAISRTVRRLAPCLMLMYVVLISRPLPRISVLQNRRWRDREGISSESIYALGAGLFFISYSLCGFPSNLILHKVGAKKVACSLLMVGWGMVVSMATMFVSNGAASFLPVTAAARSVGSRFFPRRDSLCHLLVSQQGSRPGSWTVLPGCSACAHCRRPALGSAA